MDEELDLNNTGGRSNAWETIVTPVNKGCTACFVLLPLIPIVREKIFIFKV